MAAFEVFIVCASIFTAVCGSHMQGGTVSFKATEKTHAGWVVDFKYKSSFINGQQGRFYWGCFDGNCGYEISHWSEPVENRTSNPSRWYQYEGHARRRVDNDKPFQLQESSCCWVTNKYNAGGWQLVATVDLGMRSDTEMPNSSPVTSIIPIIRIPQNCATTINLLGHDPDGDLVSCRHGYYYGECSLCSRNFIVDHNQCTLSIPSRMSTGSYVVELILEDFPKDNIYLTYNDGTRVHKYRPLNRKSRELPKDSQKYYWYDTTLSVETIMESSTTSHYATEEGTTEPLLDTSATPHYTREVTSTEPLLDTSATTHYITEEDTTEPLLDSTTTSHYATEEKATQSLLDTTAITHYTTVETTTEPLLDTIAATQYTTDEATTQSLLDITTTTHYTTVETTTQPLLDTIAATQYTTDEATTHPLLHTMIPYETTGWEFDLTSDPSIHMESLSRISLQFLVEVTSTAPSCALGDYRPKFTTPTPRQGERLLTNVGSVFQLHLSAQAAYATVSDFRVSGPPGITKSLTRKSRSTTKSIVVEWTPSEKNVGDHVPFCFIAETSNGYQSEMRCVIALVGPSRLDNIELTCHENTMTLIAAKSSDHELYENQFRLNDPKCLVSSNSSHLIASVAYNSCGTEIEETEHEIVFKNQATSFSDRLSVITRKHGVSIPFNCSFPKKSRVSASFLAHKSDYVFTEAGFGNFTYKFQFYTDDRFVEVETRYPLEVTLQELLYMEIQVSSSIPDVQLFVESCKAAPHDNPDDPTFYDIIQNGCIKDETLVVYSATRTQYRFAMEAFAFIGDFSEVYVSCTVILCKNGEPGTRCSQGCIRKSLEDSNTQRHRRSLSSESQQHFISQGPLRMKGQSPSNADQGTSPALNVNTLVISLSGVVVVALLGFIVHVYTKRVRLSGYELLKTQDF